MDLKRIPGKFILSHVDAFYSSGVLETFLSGVADLIAADVVSKEDFEIRFINGEPDKRLIEQLNLQGNVVYARLPSTFKENMSYLTQSTAILFIQRGACNGYIPERFFEFLTLRKRILALVPNPVAYQEYTLGNEDIYVADIQNYAGILSCFLQMYQDWQGSLLTGALDEISPTIVPANWPGEKIHRPDDVIHINTGKVA